CQAIPRRNLLGPRRELGVCRDHTELLLADKRLLTNLVPTLVELSLELVDPFLWCMMRRMGRAAGVIGEERLLRCDCMLFSHPGGRSVGQQFVEMLRIGAELLRCLVRKSILEDRCVPLIRISADETEEVVETKTCRPKVKRTGLAGI